MGNQTVVSCTVLPGLTEARIEAFWSMVDTDADCWLWRGGLNLGYPIFNLVRYPVRRRAAARVIAWTLEVGPIPQLGELVRACEQPLCIRPDHHWLGTARDRPGLPREERIAGFWARVERRGPDECWPWLAGTNGKGYGSLHWYGEATAPHRLAWVLANGPVPGGAFVCHHCDNPPCCNPTHLFAGLPADNSADMAQKGRASGPCGVDHPMAKLNVEQVVALRAQYQAGASARAVGVAFGLSTMAAYRVAVGKAYSNVPMGEVRKTVRFGEYRGRKVAESFADPFPLSDAGATVRDMSRTPSQRLADALIPGGWRAYVESRRPHISWRIIARDLLNETEGAVDVTPETLRAWCAETDAEPVEAAS